MRVIIFDEISIEWEFDMAELGMLRPWLKVESNRKEKSAEGTVKCTLRREAETPSSRMKIKRVAFVKKLAAYTPCSLDPS